MRAGTGRDQAPVFDFPDYAPTGPYPRAVLTARNVGTDDAFDPGTGDFSWGADFRLDAASTGRPDDNGNNVVQRGLSSDPVMFKLDLDASLRPSCTVHGAAGKVKVMALAKVAPGTWYRARCTREGDRLTVTVSELLSGGSAGSTDRSNEGPVGDVTFEDPRIPISVGGKVAHNGVVIGSASDQFNGELADPFVELG